MLTPAELKIAIATLNSRRSWLKKTLEDSNLDKALRDEHRQAYKLIESVLQKLPQINEKTAAIAASPPSPLRKHMGPKVLVAEDDEDSATLISELLQDIGLKEIELVHNGMEAFDKIKSAKEPYDLILCDWDMPELSGLDVYKKAKASNTLRGAHFMMVSAVSEAARIREAIQHGVSDYIVKPIDMEIMEGKVKAAMGDKMPEQKAAQ